MVARTNQMGHRAPKGSQVLRVFIGGDRRSFTDCWFRTLVVGPGRLRGGSIACTTFCLVAWPEKIDRSATYPKPSR